MKNYSWKAKYLLPNDPLTNTVECDMSKKLNIEHEFPKTGTNSSFLASGKKR